MKSKRIKHNDLLPWFTDDHGTLPASYLRSCEKFFKAGRKDAEMYERQASSNKPQASSLTINNNRIIKDYENK